LSAFPAGVYYLLISDEKEKIIRKLIRF